MEFEHEKGVAISSQITAQALVDVVQEKRKGGR